MVQPFLPSLYSILERVRDHQRTGNQQRIAQILTAQASIVRVACYFNMTCKDDSWEGKEKGDPHQVIEFNQLVRNISNANSDALKAGNTLNFNNIDQGGNGHINVAETDLIERNLSSIEKIRNNYSMVHLVSRVGLTLIYDVPPSCPLAQPLLSIIYRPKQNQTESGTG